MASGPFELAVVIGIAVAIVTILAIGHATTQSWDVRTLPPDVAVGGPIPVIGPNHPYLFQPVSGRVTPGVKYGFALTTKCGLGRPVGPDFDGTFWDPAEPNDPTGGPPTGFKAPVDDGYMVLVSPTVAEFHSSGGATVRLTRHPGSIIASPCR